jgi:hypothetical protein
MDYKYLTTSSDGHHSMGTLKDSESLTMDEALEILYEDVIPVVESKLLIFDYVQTLEVWKVEN